MKSNVIKYVFLVIIAILLIFAIYKVNSENANKKGTNGSDGNGLSKDITKEIKLAVANLDTMNPILSKNKNVQEVGKLIYEPLVNITQDYKAEPCLATEWAKSDENSYIVKLRENVKWSNGESFNGGDVRFTIDRLKEIDSIYSYNVQYVIGVDVVDDYTVRIKLDREIPFFEYNLSFPILSKAYYEGENFTQTEKNKNPIGTGMFKISSLNDSNFELEKNNEWWNKKEKNAVIEKIIVNTNTSMAAVYNTFKMGNIDFVNTANLNYTDYIGTLGYSTKEYEAREHGFIALNTQNPLLANLEVRQAILAAIDKNNIVANAYAGKYYVADFPLGYGNWLDYPENQNPTYNIELSNKLLEDSGWTLRRGIWQTTVNYRTQKLSLNLLVKSSDSNRVNIANVIQAQLAQAGIEIDVISVNDNSFNAKLSAKDYDMVLVTSDVSASPDLSTYFGDDNLANYANNEVTEIMKTVSNSTDENVLKENYKRLKEIYKTEVPYISLYFSKNVVLYNTSLAGEVSPNWFNPFYNIENWYK